jgi:chromosome partitioning protein
LQGRYQDIVIDAGGQDSEALRSAMTIATHMLLPFRPKRRDLKTLAHMEQVLKLAKTVNPDLIARAIITQCPTLPSQVQRILDAKDACKSFGINALNAITTNRNVYDDADENGLSVFEVNSDQKAKAEIKNIANEFLGI